MSVTLSFRATRGIPSSDNAAHPSAPSEGGRAVSAAGLLLPPPTEEPLPRKSRANLPGIPRVARNDSRSPRQRDLPHALVARVHVLAQQAQDAEEEGWRRFQELVE